MKLFLNNAIKKYKYMPIEMKAAAWYAIGNIIQKIAPWLVMIILTHYLTLNHLWLFCIQFYIHQPSNHQKRYRAILVRYTTPSLSYICIIKNTVIIFKLHLIRQI